MTTINFCVKGAESIVEEFYGYVWHGQYLPKDAGEITVQQPGQNPITFRRSTEEKADGIILVYDGENQTSWNCIVPFLNNREKPTVIASWRTTKNISGTDKYVELVPKECSFVDERFLDWPHYCLIFCEDIWQCLGDIAENKLGHKVGDLVYHMSAAYWG